jgi:flagellar protein FliL
LLSRQGFPRIARVSNARPRGTSLAPLGDRRRSSATNEEDAMASAAHVAEGAGGAAAKGGGKLKLILVLVVLLGAGGGAYFAGLLPFGAKSEAKAEGEAAEGGHGAGGGAGEHGEAKGGADKKVGAIRPMDPFIANLADEDSDRYIKTTVQVEFLDVEAPEAFEHRLPQIRDLILTLLTNRTFEDIRTPDGKERLREDVIDRINHAMEREAVRAVYFTEFIVQ